MNPEGAERTKVSSDSRRHERGPGVSKGIKEVFNCQRQRGQSFKFFCECISSSGTGRTGSIKKNL